MSTYSFEQPGPIRDHRDSYFAALNGDIAILARIAAQFAVHETSPPTMALMAIAGSAFRDNTVVEVPARTLPPIAAPATNPRIDRVVIDTATDAVVIVRGTEATTPTAPPVPAGHLPLARLALTPGMGAITNAAITDERVLASGSGTGGSGGLIGVRTFTTSGTYTPTPGTRSVIVEVQGGGGSGGGCGATSGTQAATASGGAAGSYARSYLTSGFANAVVTVGTGGAAPVAGATHGNSGEASKFGAGITSPGGGGGNPGVPWPNPLVAGGAPSAAPPTGANIFGCPGGPGGHAFHLNLANVIGGTGGPSSYGGGGTAGGGGTGWAAPSPGAGGGGSSSIPGTPARSGGAGGAGIVIIYEYG